MKKAIRWLDINFEPLMMSFTFFLMAGLITVQVILRFVFKTGFAWGEEISRFIFVWLVFLAIPYAARNGRHIGIDFVREKFPEVIRKSYMLLIDLSAIVMFGIFLKSAFDIVRHAVEYGDSAQTLNITMNWLHYAAVVGYILIELRLIQSLWWKLSHFNASYELFRNTNGRYSGATELFFMPEDQRQADEDLLDSAAVAEEALRKIKKGGKGA